MEAQLPTPHYQAKVMPFDGRELEVENHDCLTIRCATARQSVDLAMDLYGFTRHFAELLASLSDEEIERVSKIGYSLLGLNHARFIDLMKSIKNSKTTTVSVNSDPSIKEQIISENRGAFVRRWHLIQIARTESMRRYGVDETVADYLENATYDNLETISKLGIPLFKLDESYSTILNLAKVTQSPKDLEILAVLSD